MIYHCLILALRFFNERRVGLFKGTLGRLLLGCFGSTATRTIGVASKLRGVNGGQAGDEDSVADFSTNSCSPPIPKRHRGIVKALFQRQLKQE